MKKILLVIFAITIFFSLQPAFASWAYRFVVYSGDIYKVTDEPVQPYEIEKKIGQVTRYSDIEGTYAGNFSNAFPKGTGYYSIKEASPNDVIAIKVQEGTYVKAVNQGHYDNDHLLTPSRIGGYLLVGIIAAAVIYFIWRYARKVRQKE
ncbi:hypothetical protein ACF3MZ_10350 [Paenibacillaceae bacterium WGS1546]|uniref:hypothetical protein n=1 Tax=Cohnella sp. WGS1546 TaxID=3366810 RepID=UPI00372D5E12